MVARPGAPYRSANAGELSPDAAGRVDIKQFYSAGLRFKNVEPVPLSGFRRMAGSHDCGPVRPLLQALAKTGEAAAAGPHTGEQTVWEAAVSGSVAAVDIAALAASAGTHAVKVQVFAGGSWQDFGQAFEAGVAAQAVTAAAAPRAGMAATAVRVRVTFSASASVTCGTVTVLAESGTTVAPRYASLRHDSGSRYDLSLQPGFLDIYEDDAFVAGVWLPAVTAGIQPDVDFYAENATVGIAHRDLETQRVRRSGLSSRWVRDLWPWDGLPKVDLGGVYAKTDDIWVIDVTWSGNSVYVYLSVTVDGETTPSVPYVDGDGETVTIDAGAVDLAATAALLQAELENLPSMGPGITVSIVKLKGKHHEVTITFGGALSGVEYQIISTIANTADAAALSSHRQIGKTDFEPLFSGARGWPGVFGFAQDRLAYGDIKAAPPAFAFSQAAEYFKLDLEIAGPAAPRLDRLRAGQVAERVLAFAEATYFLVFTDKAVHFASNRTVNKADPLNMVQLAAAGTVPNCKPVNLEGKIWYIGTDQNSAGAGHQLLSLAYSELETTFEATPEHILATHLVDGVIRLDGQQAASRADASRLWMLRGDGRVIQASIIRSQEVTGFCEWQVWGSGAARELHVNAANAVRLCVVRGGALRHERQDRDTLFQASVQAEADLAGVVAGLHLHEGRSVWVEQGGFIEGPLTVAGGAITLDTRWTGPLTVGLWEPPVWESMPRQHITRNDEVVMRPGRIHKAVLTLMGTTSVAVGANGQPADEVPLAVTGTPVDAAAPPFTGQAMKAGLLGAVTGTTLVVTQVRPGELHVRDIVIEERL